MDDDYSETVTCGEHMPEGVTDCTYCGCEIEAHDPVFVYEEQDGERTPAGQFCNYGCLSVHLEEAGLADGSVCRLDA